MASEKSPTRHRWDQFRLRTLLFVMLLSAISFGWIASERAERRREQKVVAWVSEKGGAVVFAHHGWFDRWVGGTVQTVDFSSRRIMISGNPPVVDLSPLVGLENLATLNLRTTLVSDLLPLAGLETIRSLDLSSTEVTDLSPLAELERLEVLYLYGAPVSKEQVRTLQESLPHLMIYGFPRFPIDEPVF